MKKQFGVDFNYWLRRRNMMYYKYINFLVKAFAYDAKNIIDIGSANTEYIEDYFWIKNKYTLDIKNPYSSQNVKSIEVDFLKFSPSQKFDFVTCLQVLEHISEVRLFAKKLLDISNKVLISVPYNWPIDAESEHIHDPINEEKLYNWFGRDPTYSIVVSEPLRNPEKRISKRIICYYGPINEKLNYSKLISNVNELENREKIRSVKSVSEIASKMEDNVDLIIENQNDNFKKILLELKKNEMEKDILALVTENQNLEKTVQDIEVNVAKLNSKILKLKSERKIINNELNKIKRSTSWKVTAPVRMIGKIFK